MRVSVIVHIPMRLLATGPSLSDKHLQALAQLGFDVRYTKDELSEDELIKQLKDTDAYIFGGDETATRAVIESAQHLKIIAFLGAGYAELIDADAATKAGIAVTN